MFYLVENSDADSENQTFVLNDAVTNMKIKQINELEDLFETNTKSEDFEAVEDLKLNGSNRCMTESLVGVLIFLEE